MSDTSRRATRQLVIWSRRIFSRTFRELLRSGRILQTLWDAAQLQGQQREQLRQLGELTLKLAAEGKIQDLRVERMRSKIERSERILKRQEAILKSYQRRSDVHKVLTEDNKKNRDDLLPV